jgi:hypothetical protein
VFAERLARLGAEACCAAIGLLLFAALGPPAKAHVFDPPQVLNSYAATDSGSDNFPHVATDGAGNWVAAWDSTDTLGGTIGTDLDILVTLSTDGGTTWTAAAPLTTYWGDDRAPRIAADGSGNWVAVWGSSAMVVTSGEDYDIHVVRSTDGGATWTDPGLLNSNAADDSGEDSWPDIATDGAGNWVAVWRSDDSLGETIGTDYDILVARSTDGGATWTAPAALNSNAGSDSASDGGPQLATDGAGNWVVVWISDDSLGGTIGTDSDAFVARSTDAGATWTTPAVLNSNAASDSRDDDSLSLATDGSGGWVAVWRSMDSLGGTIGTDSDIIVARSTNAGASWTAVAPVNSNAADDLAFDMYPCVATDGEGTWTAIWNSQDSLGGTIGSDLDILMARSTDGGASWTEVAALNSNAADDSGGDWRPCLAADATGRWVAVWQSYTDLDGTIGTDLDIFFATAGRENIPVPMLTPIGRGLVVFLLALAVAGWQAGALGRPRQPPTS